MKAILTTSLSLLLHVAVYSQSSDTALIVPGSSLLDMSGLKSSVTHFDMFSNRDGAEKKAGSLDENFIIKNQNGQKMGLRVCRIVFGENKILDSGLCMLSTLQPIYHRSAQTNKTMSFDFKEQSVLGSVTTLDAGGNTTIEVEHPTRMIVFDSYFEDILARTLRPTKGLLFKFPEYIYERGGLVWSTGEVVGEEEFNTRAVWKILFFEKNKLGEVVRTTTYLIDKVDRSILLREYLTVGGKTTMRPRK